ncbi:MAG: hypothetical protein ABII12_14260 [Planctomycetota bacterium]
MAGVAPQQRGGSNASTMGMIAAIIVAALLLGALIWLFTQQEGLKRSAEQAELAKSRLASGADESAAKQMFPDAGAPDKTLIGEMNNSIKMLCSQITGSREDAPSTAVAKLDSALQEIADAGVVPDAGMFTADDGAVAVISHLHELFKTERDQRERVVTEFEKAQNDLAEMTKSNADLGTNFQGELAKLEEQVAGLQTARDELERTKETDVRDLADRISAKQDQLDGMRTERSKLVQRVRSELAERDKLLTEQRNALRELRGPGAIGAQELALARKPVGKVLRALPGDALVHIDLGRRDNVTLGMTFSIYSADERVPTDGIGKATVEVYSLGERTAECRVTTPPSPDDPILEGDLAGNIVLSQNRAKKPQFCIVGRFDVDYDGQFDAQGRDAIVALVQRYGGEVVPSVTALTDYVVVGAAPGGSAFAGATEAPAAAPEPVGDVEDEIDDETEEDALDEEETFDEEEEASDELDDEDDESAEDEEEDFADDEEADEEDSEADEDESEDDELDEPEDKTDATADLPFSIRRAEEVDPTRLPRRVKALSDLERYKLAIRRAEMFSIPRLPQDRFLNFVGIEPGPAAVRILLQR